MSCTEYIGEINEDTSFEKVTISPFKEYEQKFEAQRDTNLFYVVHAPEKNPMADFFLVHEQHKKIRHRITEVRHFIVKKMMIKHIKVI